MHNGWKFVSEPHIVYLEPEYEVGKSGRKSPASQSSLRGTLQANSPAPLYDVTNECSLYSQQES